MPRTPEKDPDAHDGDDAVGDDTVADASERGSARSAAFERFEVEKELGKGGMAIVFRARDSETGDKVALKLLTGNLDHAGRTRFAREVKNASRLSHPNICRVVAVGENEGRPFLAMELVRGSTLADVAKRGPALMPARVAAAIMAQLFDALAHAHAAGVLHRDLKPANVMLTPDGAVKLLDFGIAKSIDDETVTKTGGLVGTPAYMAPEQVKLEPIDHRADLFSAGALLLAFLRNNKHRFSGLKLDSTQMLIRVALEPTPPLLEVATHAPIALDNVLAGLTALDPALRFADAAAAKASLVESGLVRGGLEDEDARALLVRFFTDPQAVADELNSADARAEGERGRALAKMDGGAPAAVLALHRASLLAPDGPWRAERDALAQAHGYVFTLEDDPKIKKLLAELALEPQGAATLKRLSDVMKARGHMLLHAVYLWRYVRQRPDDTLALQQLRVLLDGPALDAAHDDENSSVRLSTKSIVAGIKTGGLKARPIDARASTQRRAAAQLMSLQDTSQRAIAPAPLPPVAQGPATVIVAGGARDDTGGRGRTLGAVAVAVLVVLAILAVVQAVRPSKGGGGDEVARDASAQLAQAEAALADDPARAIALTTAVLDAAPSARDGREALWIRARAHAAREDRTSARADCDAYLARATDFHDPHLLQVKELLASLGKKGAP